jgi:hypothetical protein
VPGFVRAGARRLKGSAALPEFRGWLKQRQPRSRAVLTYLWLREDRYRMAKTQDRRVAGMGLGARALRA